jgi:asparagine synthase (glutamine-hydrolysing)
MCSIAGIIDTTRARADASTALARMAGAMYHRGPDDSGVWWREAAHGPAVGLANTRLAIIDLSPAGHMPMEDAVTGCALTYNGETYNFQDLRREMDEPHAPWRSHTDTEVVLRAYQRWGAAAWARLRGMFALGLWDEAQQRLLLARDPFGIKPVYYYQTDELFVFASEIRALLASELVPRRLSRAGAASFLHYGAVDEPGTIIEGVRAVRPGHYLTVAADGGRIAAEETPYAADLLPSEAPARTRAEAVGRLREVLRESVKLHLVSDVPLGLFLSGGIDSSALVALASEVTSERPRTFSVVFAEQELSEAAHARRVAEKFQTVHTEIPLSEERLLSLMPDALAAMDQPTQDAVNSFVVSQAVRAAGVTVALSGLGGDELFAGYPGFQRARQMQAAARVPRILRHAAAAVGGALLNDSVTRKKTWRLLAGDGSADAAIDLGRQLFLAEEVEALSGHAPPTATAKLWPSARVGGDAINAASLHELQNYMANTLLRDTDCASMAHSLEVRVPLVDAAVASFVLPLPGAWKVDGARPKPLLVDALGDLLPPEIVNRPKMGFVLPIGGWLQARLRPEADAVFRDDALLAAVGLRPDAAATVWRRFLAAPRKVGYTRPWALFVLARWCALHDVKHE